MALRLKLGAIVIGLDLLVLPAPRAVNIASGSFVILLVELAHKSSAPIRLVQEEILREGRFGVHKARPVRGPILRLFFRMLKRPSVAEAGRIARQSELEVNKRRFVACSCE